VILAGGRDLSSNAWRNRCEEIGLIEENQERFVTELTNLGMSLFDVVQYTHVTNSKPTRLLLCSLKYRYIIWVDLVYIYSLWVGVAHHLVKLFLNCYKKYTVLSLNKKITCYCKKFTPIDKSLHRISFYVLFYQILIHAFG